MLAREAIQIAHAKVGLPSRSCAAAQAGALAGIELSQ
jgi:hypothetical protein